MYPAYCKLCFKNPLWSMNNSPQNSILTSPRDEALSRIPDTEPAPHLPDAGRDAKLGNLIYWHPGQPLTGSCWQHENRLLARAQSFPELLPLSYSDLITHDENLHRNYLISRAEREIRGRYGGVESRDCFNLDKLLGLLWGASGLATASPCKSHLWHI